MTQHLTHTVGDVVHEYARDRAPWADPIARENWRRRWNCRCGAVGGWTTRTEAQIHVDWQHHVRRHVQMATRRAS